MTNSKKCKNCDTVFHRKDHLNLDKGQWRNKINCTSNCRSNQNYVKKGYTSGANHYNWKGGVQYSCGYKSLLRPNHPDANKRGYIAEHRLVMEKKLGRRLLPTEDVHHLDFSKTNNEPDNLHLFNNRAEHSGFHKRLNLAVQNATGGLFRKWP
tara:strand:- start:8705 stop:9163 length:459 start_codon:yes stop_codon:yes gene_type:complete